ncbi:hypothetical protein BK767_18645 [Bacillus thuringiensis serovar kyushuensis]|nr:hypothetical protein BK767_18645 [Bacillus thuringiensis serovar kyushuensis]OTZ74523.1 hypothetical protein BK768_13915 [Bacillus thuringiensis serovar tohokuensis]
MKQFLSAQHLASWACLSPRYHESARKKKNTSYMVIRKVLVFFCTER